MRLLAIDTALGDCSAAVLHRTADGIDVLHERSRTIGRGHAEQLMSVIGEVLDAAGLTYADLTKIAVTVGPGSYTGLRVGLATARALSLTLKIPAVGIGTLQALAAGGQADHPGQTIIAAIDARHGAIYHQAFSANDAISQPAIDPIVDVVADLPKQMVLAVGSGAQLLSEAAERAGHQMETLDLHAPAIADVARLGAGAPVQSVAPEPLYLKPPDAQPAVRGKIARQ